jgi:hypothetical protein
MVLLLRYTSSMSIRRRTAKPSSARRRIRFREKLVPQAAMRSGARNVRGACGPNRGLNRGMNRGKSDSAFWPVGCSPCA